MSLLPPEVRAGYVYNRVLRAIGDRPEDEDRFPDGIPAKGTVTFTPKNSVKQVVSNNTGVTVTREPVVCTIHQGEDNPNLAGLLIDEAGAVGGVWLVVGEWTVSYQFDDRYSNVPNQDIVVTEEHTEDNPLDVALVAGLTPSPTIKFVVNEQIYVDSKKARDETLTARDETIQARDLVLPARDQTLAARDQAVAAAENAESPYKEAIPNNADLNDYVTNGVHGRRLGQNVHTITNRPPDAPNQPFRLEVYEVSPSITHQVFTVGEGGELYSWVRYQFTATWHPWHLSLDTERDLTQDFPFRKTDRSKVTIFGDSQVEGQPLTTAMQSALGGDVTFSNRGRSGDTVDQIAIRAGAKELWFTVSGGQIPASGAVSLTTMQPFDTGRDRAFSGSLSGVGGTLRFTAADRSWAFTRSASGSAVTVEGTQPFVSSQAGTEDHTLIVWMGGNNSWEAGNYLAPDINTHVISVYQEIMNWAAPQKRVLFPGMTYGNATASGAPARTPLADAVNQCLASKYPAHYTNINQWLIDHGMEAAGLEDTQADIDARQDGLMPPSLLADDVHFKPEVRTAIGEHLAQQLRRRGWA